MTDHYWLDLIEPLNQVNVRWRDYPDSFLTAGREFADTETLRLELVTTFLKDSNEDWLSEVTPYCESHPLEWVMNILSAAEENPDISVLQRTSRAIWGYLSKSVHEWLVLKEEAYNDAGIH